MCGFPQIPEVGVGSPRVGVTCGCGDQTQPLWKSTKGFYLLSHLSGLTHALQSWPINLCPGTSFEDF